MTSMVVAAVEITLPAITKLGMVVAGVGMVVTGLEEVMEEEEEHEQEEEVIEPVAEVEEEAEREHNAPPLIHTQLQWDQHQLLDHL